MATQVIVPRPTLNRHFLKDLTLWALQIGIATVLLQAGIPKLLGNPMMVQLFGIIGIGQWFRYLTGGLEVTRIDQSADPQAGGIRGPFAGCGDGRRSRNASGGIGQLPASTAGFAGGQPAGGLGKTREEMI